MSYCLEVTTSSGDNPLLVPNSDDVATNRVVTLSGIADPDVALSVDVFQHGSGSNQNVIGRLRVSEGEQGKLYISDGIMVGSGGIDVVFNDSGSGHILDIYWD